jgi:hypothetical protein
MRTQKRPEGSEMLCSSFISRFGIISDEKGNQVREAYNLERGDKRISPRVRS